MRSFALLCAGLLWVGCGAVEDNQDGTFSLTATPSTLEVPIASSGKVTVAIDRVGSVGDVMLSAPGLPSGITATFATNPVPAGMSASEVTLAVAPGTPAGASNITIVGSAAGSEKTVTVTVNAQTITVSGRLRDKREGITVRIPGKDAATSGPGGTFTFTNVSPPYDLYTFGSSGGLIGSTPTVIYYQGLTRPDPIINAPQGFFLFPVGSSGTISGTASGTANTANPMIIAWSTGGEQNVNAGASSYSFTASWPMADSVNGILYGIQFSRKATGAPDVFTGYASKQATVAKDVTNTVNLVMAAPATAALTGTITPPSGFPNPTLTLTQQLGDRSVTLWTGAATTADATIPLVSAGKAALSGSARLADGASSSYVHPGLASATDVSFTMPAPPTQTAPVNAAVNVASTTPFTWSAAQDTVYELSIAAAAMRLEPSKAHFLVYTTSTTANIPAVPELPVPPNQGFSWAVRGYGPQAAINDAASETGLEPVSSADFQGDRHWVTSSAIRSFTTAP